MKNATRPATWRSVKLGETLLKLGSGVTPRGGKESYVLDGVPLIRSQNVLWGKLSLRDVAFIPNKQHARMLGSTVQPMDVLLNITGASIGRACVVPLGTPEANVNQHVCILRPRQELSPQYLLAQLLSTDGQRQIDLFQAGGNREGLNYDQIRSIKFSLPPLPEQRKIADILSTWYQALETLEALIAAKDRQKQALMQQLLTGKTRVKGAKGKWKKVHMGDVLERVFRHIDWHADLPLNLVSLRRRCGGLFRRPDVKGSEYKTQDLHEIRAGDFLISKRQVVHGAWGYVTPEFEGGHVSKEYAIFDNRASDKLHMPFFAWLAQTRRLIRLARVSSTGVHIEKLIFDPNVFLRESIRIPATLDEQQQIAAILDTADQEINLLRTQRASIDQQKRGLMQRLLTGKLRVNA